MTAPTTTRHGVPGAEERCNGIDDDCDGTPDGAAADALCADADGVMAASCVAPSCAIDACVAGFADCDGLAESGCEVTTDRDPRNCGGCGVACSPGDTCGTTVAGRCDTSPLVELAAGSLTFVARRSNGRLAGWGESGSFQTGTASAADVLVPQTAVQGVVGSVAMGGNHGCAVRPDRRLQCWGDNGRGQLGDGTTSARTTLTVPGLSNVTTTCGSNEHTCALTRTGDVYCWGLNAEGMLGTGTTVPLRTVPSASVAGLSGVTDIYCGSRFSCAMQPRTGGGQEVYCWGSSGRRRARRATSSRPPRARDARTGPTDGSGGLRA